MLCVSCAAQNPGTNLLWLSPPSLKPSPSEWVGRSPAPQVRFEQRFGDGRGGRHLRALRGDCTLPGVAPPPTVRRWAKVKMLNLKQILRRGNLREFPHLRAENILFLGQERHLQSTAVHFHPAAGRIYCPQLVLSALGGGNPTWTNKAALSGVPTGSPTLRDFLAPVFRHLQPKGGLSL